VARVANLRLDADAARSATSDFTLAAANRPEGITVAAAVDRFIEAAEAGQVVNRSGRPYMPSALRDVRGILEYHVVPELGTARLRDVRRADVQRLVDRRGAEHLSESRIRSVVSALRALYGYAIDQGLAEFNPADGLVMPPGDEPLRSRPDELWGDPPAWEDRPPRREASPSRRDASPPRRDASPPRRDATPPGREARPARQGDREAYEPIAQLPERILSFALKAVFVLFALFALVALFESV
jgi:Phage integrase, N-terminal SAM-like domain